MKFFFPDSQDQIHPAFDFSSETYAATRARQHDDRYAHEVLARSPYDGILVSKTVVDGMATNAGRYTLPQRHRLFRSGVHRFFRLDASRMRALVAMGDCGAFSYVAQDCPPYTVDDVIDFYDGCGFDLGLSLDHVLLSFTLHEDREVPASWCERRDLTLQLADEFLARHRARRCSFVPVGVAQGWSPLSMADSVSSLQRMGYTRVALGGMVPLKTPEIVACVQACANVRAPETEFHLLGVTRCDHVLTFEGFGVTSFDSTSPFRQAFKDDRDNYYAPERTYTAIRVPQVDGNPRLKRRILAGEVDQTRALVGERRCLRQLELYNVGSTSLIDVLDALNAYAEICGETRDRSASYAETLGERPWESCMCGVCARLGVHIVIFRGSERNKARGFHNLHVFRLRLEGNREAALADDFIGTPA